MGGSIACPISERLLLCLCRAALRRGVYQHRNLLLPVFCRSFAAATRTGTRQTVVAFRAPQFCCLFFRARRFDWLFWWVNTFLTNPTADPCGHQPGRKHTCRKKKSKIEENVTKAKNSATKTVMRTWYIKRYLNNRFSIYRSYRGAREWAAFRWVRQRLHLSGERAADDSLT